MTARRGFVAGVKAMGPVLLGIAPFGLISGVAAVDVGMDPLQIMGMSLLIFAGTSQLAAIDLVAQRASAPVVILTVAVINIRMMMYSASIAPYLRDLSARWRSLLAYLLTDHVYALAIVAVEDDDRPVTVKWYVLGLGAAIWIVWQVSTVAVSSSGRPFPTSGGSGLSSRSPSSPSSSPN
ncbi:AzlC family ABC transporter permease [Haloarcula nitratireducens]|uniref:AzlC family ABC transporter permease n=1 Tax=Haloarcula nitratireducens TaxID=2487749 RepID=A0AAW4PHC0_9EURY|nr:AzlC family ABC transporter permease [Halomicroarcula nitratireducens]MBX0297028.1 AzlC family ABC transporter permease [Halomicroarcula nitratireducens]